MPVAHKIVHIQELFMIHCCALRNPYSVVVL